MVNQGSTSSDQNSMDVKAMRSITKGVVRGK